MSPALLPASCALCRLDLGGPLMANLFRALFRKLTKDVRSYLQVRSAAQHGTEFATGRHA
jgi:hypothetical protein